MIDEFAPAEWNAHLDHVGRWLLTSIDYREWGFVILLTLVVFSLWRRNRYGAWPPRDDHIRLLFALSAVIGGLTAMVVLLLTKPPAIETLSGPMLVLLGLGIPILIFGESFPRIKALFFPKKAPTRQAKDQEDDSASKVAVAPIQKSRK